jgi:hypothetical protein
VNDNVQCSSLMIDVRAQLQFYLSAEELISPCLL